MHVQDFFRRGAHSFLQNTSCIRKLPGHLKGREEGGRGVHPLHSPPRSTPVNVHVELHVGMKSIIHLC